MRRALHELLNIGNAVQRVMNDVFIGLRKLYFSAQLLDVVTISCRARHSSRRSMWLLQVPGISQIGHYIPYRGRAESLTAGAGEHTRSNWLARGDKRFHDRGQNFALSISNPMAARRHDLISVTTNSCLD